MKFKQDFIGFISLTYSFESLISTIALIITIYNRLKIQKRCLYEQMILNICYADLIFSISATILNACYYFDWRGLKPYSTTEVAFGYIQTILFPIECISLMLSIFWAFWIAFTTLQNVINPSFCIKKSYPYYSYISLIIVCVPTLTFFFMKFYFWIETFGNLQYLILQFLIVVLYIISIFQIKRMGIPVKSVLKQIWIFPAITMICLFSDAVINLFFYYHAVAYFLCGVPKYLLGLFDSIAYKLRFDKFQDEFELEQQETQDVIEMQ